MRKAEVEFLYLCLSFFLFMTVDRHPLQPPVLPRAGCMFGIKKVVWLVIGQGTTNLSFIVLASIKESYASSRLTWQRSSSSFPKINTQFPIATTNLKLLVLTTRSVLKPRDVKHRNKLRAAFTTLSTLEEAPGSAGGSRYWTEPYL